MHWTVTGWLRICTCYVLLFIRVLVQCQKYEYLNYLKSTNAGQFNRSFMRCNWCKFQSLNCDDLNSEYFVDENNENQINKLLIQELFLVREQENWNFDKETNINKVISLRNFFVKSFCTIFPLQQIAIIFLFLQYEKLQFCQ